MLLGGVGVLTNYSVCVNYKRRENRKEKFKLVIELQPRERNLQFSKTAFFFNETQPSEICFNRFRVFFTVSLLLFSLIINVNSNNII